jgi:rubrerythrin
MEKSNSISNIPKTNTRYNNFYYNKYKTKPPTILKKLDTTIIKKTTDKIDIKPPINSNKKNNMDELLTKKEDIMESLKKTNLILAQTIFTLNDKIDMVNNNINNNIQDLNRTIEMRDLKKQNTKLTQELIILKDEMNTVYKSYNFLNKLFIKNIVSSNNEDTSDIKKNLNEIKEKLTCKICFDNTINMILEPCGHTAICSNCYTSMRMYNNRKCPICNKLITSSKKIYLPI